MKREHISYLMALVGGALAIMPYMLSMPLEIMVKIWHWTSSGSVLFSIIAMVLVTERVTFRAQFGTLALCFVNFCLNPYAVVTVSETISDGVLYVDATGWKWQLIMAGCMAAWAYMAVQVGKNKRRRSSMV